ncbi:MAG: hypothetical protein U0X41_10110 [Chitinophagales bacterium]
MKKMFFLLIVVVATTACNPIIKTYTSRNVPINREAIPYNPVVAELKVDISHKVSGSIKAKNVTVENAKQLAIYNAMETSGADVVVDPVFKIETKGIKTTASVTGYFGSYDNIHKASESELQNLKLLKESIPTQIIPDKTPTVISKKKKGFTLF